MTNIVQHEPGKLEYPYGDASDDEGILAAVLNALYHNSGVPSEHIRAQVKDGRVILSGIVCQDYEKRLAEQAAVASPGVKAVMNNIQLES